MTMQYLANRKLLQALILVLLLSSCGEKKDPTLINGIVVPLMPDPVTNNETLGGVDSNINGLRDDAELMIASLSHKKTYESSTFLIAKLEQRLATELITTQTEYSNIRDQQVCLDKMRTKEEKQILSRSNIKGAIVNTRARSAQYTENMTRYGDQWASGERAICN
jgi:hypothetical protein